VLPMVRVDRLYLGPMLRLINWVANYCLLFCLRLDRTLCGMPVFAPFYGSLDMLALRWVSSIDNRSNHPKLTQRRTRKTQSKQFQSISKKEADEPFIWSLLNLSTQYFKKNGYGTKLGRELLKNTINFTFQGG
jgi:hypothetical protein